MFAIITECLLRGVRDSSKFGFDRLEIIDACWAGDRRTNEVHQVHHGFEGLVDLMGNRRRHASGGRNLFCPQQGLLKPLTHGNIAQDLGRSNYIAAFISEWRDGERNIKQLTVLGDAHGFEVLDAYSGTNTRHDELFIVMKIRRNQLKDRLANHLLSRMTEKTSGGRISASNDAVQVFAHNHVLVGFAVFSVGQ